MKKSFVVLLGACMAFFNGFSQTDSLQMAGIFQKITGELKSYKIDTSAAPDDKVTKKIKELRELKGGFNINEAIAYKMQEDEMKGEVPKKTMALLREEFTNGKAKQWLENATIWIYRHHFSYKELKGLVKFYKTSAGQKLATDFPFIMMKTLMAAQIIHDGLVNQSNKK